jgi:N4-gp56 family major capsid protein
MAATEFGVNHDLAVKRWSLDLAREAAVQSYLSRFMGQSNDALIKIKKELQKAAGDKITVGLRMKLSGDGIEGDNQIEGTSAEEALSFYADSVLIDQRRKGTKSKGKMSEQRVPYNIRKEGRDALGVWFGEDTDQQGFMYLSGARGVNSDFHVSTAWSGRAGNSLQSPNSENLIYGGDASAKNDLDSSDTMSRAIVERLVVKAGTQDPMIQPFMVEGEKKFVLIMHPFQAYSLRTSTSTDDWLEIQQTAGKRGETNLIYKGSLGDLAGVVLHQHRNVIRFSDYGAGENLAAARALFLGAQAAIIGWGGNGGPGRYSWHEEMDDRGNALAITAGAIYGMKKCRFNSKDFGVIAVDTYAADPNA